MEVPKDPRPQFSFADLAVASLGLGRMPPSQQIGPDRYIIAGYWPQTPTVKFYAEPIRQAMPTM